MPAPHIVMGFATPGEGSGREKPPNCIVANDSIMMPTAMVVSIQPIEAFVPVKGRTAKRSSTIPNTPPAAIASRHASGRGRPASTPSTASTAPSIRVSPWAKFTALAADHMIWKPSATRA